jgi:hypothetical protein
MAARSLSPCFSFTGRPRAPLLGPAYRQRVLPPPSADGQGQPPPSLTRGPATRHLLPLAVKEGDLPFSCRLRDSRDFTALPFVERLRGYLSRVSCPSAPLRSLSASAFARSDCSRNTALTAANPKLHAALIPSPPPSSTRVSSRRVSPPFCTHGVSNGGRSREFRKRRQALPFPAMAPQRGLLLWSVRRPRPPFLNRDHSDPIRWSRLMDTPSGVILLKSPWVFIESNPHSKA